MYQISDAETIREHRRALLVEAEGSRLARQLKMTRTNTQGRAWGSVLVASFLLAALIGASLMLAASKPAHAQTTFTVNDAGDFFDHNVGDGVCDFTLSEGDRCGLRAAIQEANHPNNPGPDTIEFEIGGSGASGTKIIRLLAELPTISETVTINGYTQPGAKPNTLAKGTNTVLNVQLDGSDAGQFADGLVVGADDVVVRGLVINRFAFNGINVRDAAGDPDRPTGVRIEGNFIGTSASGTLDLGNGIEGVRISDGKNNTVGGTTLGKRNLISGNGDAGVSIFSGSSANRVQGNLIGTQRDGTSPLGNGRDGVEVFTSNGNTVGGTAPGAANTIAHNGTNGVTVGNGESSDDFTGNRILSNSVFYNTLLGIELRASLENDGPTPNDPGDTDEGANGLQNKPNVTSATTSVGTTIKGLLNSTPSKTFTVQFFSNPSGTDEGKKFIGSRSVTTNVEGKVSFTFSPTQKVNEGQSVTATATDPNGNTSEFSAPRSVVAQ